MDQGPYSQHFNLYVTYEWAQQARKLHYTRLERVARDRYSRFLGPFVSYEEKNVL